MKSITASVLAVLTALIAPASAVGLDSRQGGAPRSAIEVQNRVLDIVFPREEPDSTKAIYWLVLRFSPSSEPELQINIRRTVTGSEVVLYRAESKIFDSVFESVNEAPEDSRIDPAKIAKGIKVSKTVLHVPYDIVRRWQSGFYSNLSNSAGLLATRGSQFDRTGKETVALDGTFFEVWYKQGLTRLSFSIYDTDAGQFSLARWMNSVRQSAERFSVTHSR